MKMAALDPSLLRFRIHTLLHRTVGHDSFDQQSYITRIYPWSAQRRAATKPSETFVVAFDTFDRSVATSEETEEHEPR